MKRLAFALLAVLTLAILAGQPSPAQQPDKVSQFMKHKLVHAHKLLEGLAIEDFDLIAKHSQELTLVSREAQWSVLQTPQYAQHSAEFRRATEAIHQAAKKKNLDGAALAYVDMTMKCVNCHKYVRDVKMAQLKPPLSKTGELTR
jgi:hypothetical protein